MHLSLVAYAYVSWSRILFIFLLGTVLAIFLSQISLRLIAWDRSIWLQVSVNELNERKKQKLITMWQLKKSNQSDEANR
jgi:hypothetical protein